MAESTNNLSEEDLQLVRGFLEPLNKNPQNSEELNPMAKVFRQKMGYAEPIVFSDDESTQDSELAESPGDDSQEGEDSGDDTDPFSEQSTEPAPPSFKSFDDDDIDLDALLAEPDGIPEPTSSPVVDLPESEDFLGSSETSTESEKPIDLGDDPFADLGSSPDFGSESDSDFDSVPNFDFGNPIQDDVPTSEEKSTALEDDPFADLGDPGAADPTGLEGLGELGDFGTESEGFGGELGEGFPELGSELDDFGMGAPSETPTRATTQPTPLSDDPFADLGGFGGGESSAGDSASEISGNEDPFADLGNFSGSDSEDPFRSDDDFTADLNTDSGLDFEGEKGDDFGLGGSLDEDDPFAGMGSEPSKPVETEDDPFAGLGGMADEPDFGIGETVSGSPMDEDPFGDLGMDLGSGGTSSADDEPVSSVEPSFGGFDDLEPPDLDEIGGGVFEPEGVLEDELSSLMDHDQGSIEEGLTDEDLAIIQREIVKYPPVLRRKVIDCIVHNRITLAHQKDLLELIKHQQKPEDIADFLSGVLGEDVPLADTSGAFSSDGVPIISTNPIYTKEGALRRRKLIRNTVLGVAAALFFVTSFFSIYKYVIIPGRAGSHYEEGLQAIRLYEKEKDETEKKRLLRSAKEFFAKGEEIHPHSLKYLNAYGVEYLKAGRYDESFEMLFGKVEPPFQQWSERKEVPYISIHPDSRWNDSGVEIAGRIENPDQHVHLTSQDKKKRRILKAGAYIVARAKEDVHDTTTYLNLGRFHSFPARDFSEGDRSKAYKNDTLAIEYYKRVFTDSGKPDHVEARAGIARIFYNRKEFPKAAAEYNKILEIYPKDSIGHAGLISSYIEIWKKDGNPQFVLNHHRIVKNQLKVEKDLPLYILTKLASFYIDLDPEETRVRYNVTPEDQVTEMDIDDTASALLNVVFAKSEEQDGVLIEGNRYGEGYYQRGRFYLKKNEALRAMKQFELAASYDPMHYPAVLRMGEYYMRISDYTEAENLLRNAEQRYKDFRDIYGRRDEDETLLAGDPGRIYFNRGKILYLNASGILEADRIKEFPGRKIYPDRSRIQISDSDKERRKRGLYLAQEFFQLAQTKPHVLENERANRDMIYFEGWIDYMLGNFDSSLSRWSDLHESDLYHNTTLLMGMGNASYYTNQLNSALSYYLKIMQSYEAKEASIKRVVFEDQDHQEIYQILVAAYNNIGAVYERKGDSTQALQFYWKAIEAARKIELVSEVANSNKDLFMKKERLKQLPLLEDWLSPTLDSLKELVK